MKEKRAVRVSFELWTQMMEQDYTSGGLRCVEGLPKGAKMVDYFAITSSNPQNAVCDYPDLVFVFECDDWGTPTPEYTVYYPRHHTEMPVMNVVFRVAECQTCKHWTGHGDELQEMGACTAPTAFVDACTGKGLTLTSRDFGCTSYEPRETDD